MRTKRAKAPVAVAVPASAPESPIRAVSGTAPGQGGYVHFFLLTRPDGILETQVGIELPDQRIAWSVPDRGVIVSPFAETSEFTAKGRAYQMRYLYGLRPFADDATMHTLSEAMQARVFPWVEHEVGYCELNGEPGELCVSCLGFVLRMLFPGHFPGTPSLPADFARIGTGEHYTTEDLLVYLANLHRSPTSEARMERIGEAPLPESLREELQRLARSMNEMPANASPSAAPAVKSGVPVRSAQQRPVQRKRL